MPVGMRHVRGWVVAGMWVAAGAAAAEPGDVEFFESRIRPVLVQHCYACHSAEASTQGKLQAGLLLDSKQGLLRGGESGPAIVAGDPRQSLLISALRYETYEMPPAGKLPVEVIADFERWVEMGAPDPRDGGGAPLPRREAFRITDADRGHWAFQPLNEVPLPRATETSIQRDPLTGREESWSRDGLDRFIEAGRERVGVQSSPPAERGAWLRRVTYALTGLPPAAEELVVFRADTSPLAYERAVDRLLASPDFGVHWARSWLDGVRYASDVDKSGAYRDWVVRALNEDLPYDRFVKMQLAGDLLPAEGTDPARVHASGASFDGIIATGMLALAIWEQVARDLAVAEIVDSQIDVVGRQLLGLTLACARCHDHKYDPVSAEDYYGLAGIFFSSHVATGKIIADGRLANEVIEVPLLNAAEWSRNAEVNAAVAELEGRIAAASARIPEAAKLAAVRVELQALETRIAAATGDGRKGLTDQAARLRGEERKLLAEREQNGWQESPPELDDIRAWRQEIARLESTRIKALTVSAVQEGGVPGSNRERIGDAPIYIRGEYRREGPPVPRRFPTILAGEQQPPVGQSTSQSGRLELAEWIASPGHPLTARVMVNRVWQRLMGAGIVRSPDNFGRLGEPPTHPELLDYLARRFVSSGWSVKTLIRTLVLSASYRQASFAAAESVARDVANQTFCRMDRRRLTYEEFRDTLLLLGEAEGATPRPPAIGGASGWRTLFAPLERRKVDLTSAMFDGPDPKSLVTTRAETTSAPQALFLMNSPLVQSTARQLAERVMRDGRLRTDTERLEWVWLTIVGRLPQERERDRVREFLAESVPAESVPAGNALPGGAWAQLVQALLCTNEFAYLD